MDILIYGSCVSRDAFAIEGAPNLVGYFARSSVISAMSPKDPELIQADLSKNPSKFQRSVVRKDLEKTLVDELRQGKRQILLIDFIDERYDLGFTSRGSAFSISPELVRTGLDVSGFKRVKFGTEEYIALFEEAWSKLIKLTEPSLIVVNKVFWARKDVAGKELKDQNRIREANETLGKIYEIVLRLSPAVHWIEYVKDVLVSDPGHKWGIAPFHFVDRFYEEQLKQVREKMRVLESSSI
ncbi:DUF6270 domain-containing protein [Corynebacterium glucuronolyticum]|uniref:DUF6270 domain-containing protein n=1 Tax=Corynebacterium glucuronolyticum TaxID=39791 RepID=UPI00223BABC0|nr:DUF6270 domain-containing protein [Corynebacterium glucuronolyticum]MCT1443376.1 DUF6270 domain-containing protein [Corynebacterium glucuronolyticum]